MKKRIFVILLLLFVTSLTFAHPHVWIDCLVEFDGQNLKIEWIFDENYSFSILSDCDTDFNNKFSKKEIQDVYNLYFKNLENYDYFTFFKVNENRKIVKPTNFSAKFNEATEKVSYFFDLNVNKYIKKGDEILIGFYDSSFFVSYAFLENAMTSSNNYASSIKVDTAGFVEFIVK